MFLAILIIAAVIFVWSLEKGKRKKKKKPGQHLVYEVPGKSVAQCRGLLMENNSRIFEYRLEMAQNGTQYISFSRYLPTEQVMDTVYLVAFENDMPARLSLSFVKEAFGYKEPVFGEGLLDEFFAEVLGAVRINESVEKGV